MTAAAGRLLARKRSHGWLCSEVAENLFMQAWRQVHAPANSKQRAAVDRDSPSPTMVPYTTVPFLSSICTFSLESFIRNLQQKDVSRVNENQEGDGG